MRLRPLTQALAILLFSLVLAELAARAVFPIPEVADFARSDYTSFFSSEMEQSSLSNASFIYPSDPDGAQSLHELNLYGFRDKDWRVDHDPAVPRILFVGDSFVEGFLAPPSGTVPAVFEARARARGVGPVETMNLGVGAIGMQGYVQLISAAVPLFTPDIVWVVLYANDILTEPYHAWFRESSTPPDRSPRMRLAGVIWKWWNDQPVPRRWRSKPMPFFASVPHPSNPWSKPAFANRRGRHVSPKLAAAMSEGRFNPMVIGEVEEYEAQLRTHPFVKSFLTGAKRFAQSHGARLQIAYLPGRNQVTDHYLKYHSEYSLGPTLPSLTGREFQRHAKVLAVQCRKVGISFHDLTPIIRSHEERGERLYWNYDSHMTEAGYAVVGRALLDWTTLDKLGD